MAIRPIDFQVMIPKVTEVSRMQSDEQKNNLANAQSSVQTTEKQAENNIRQVISRREAHETAIRDYQEKEKQQSKKKNRGKQSTDEKDDPNKKDEGKPSRRTIDIRL